jgi:hypothetical protein
MTKAKAEEGAPGAPDMDRVARLSAGMLPPQPAMLECDRHSYPSPPQRLHNPRGTGGNGGGYLHENATR